jgi:hypothetical protein
MSAAMRASGSAFVVPSSSELHPRSYGLALCRRSAGCRRAHSSDARACDAAPILPWNGWPSQSRRPAGELADRTGAAYPAGVPDLYDVAFSFLAEDEPTARALSEKLAGRISTFVFSERQRDVAGKDGVEEFSAVFRRRSRLVVVLYRQGWGTTKWTRIEETAIKERYLDEGMSFLLVLAMQPNPTLSAWLPTMRLYFDLAAFGLDGAVGAIIARFQEAGGEAREETARQQAERLRAASKRREEGERWLKTGDAVREATRQFNAISDHIEVEVRAVAAPGLAAEIECRRIGNDKIVVESPAASVILVWNRQFANSTEYARLIVKEFDGSVPAGRLADPELAPELVEETRYLFAVDDAEMKGWRADEGDGRLWAPIPLAEHVLKRVFHRVYAASSTRR